MSPSCTLPRHSRNGSCRFGGRREVLHRQQLVAAFGGLLARSGASTPSVILIRRLAGRRAAEQAAIILANLDQVAEDLTAGAIVVLHEDSLRVRRLPMPG